jgi:hypothetical protein
MARAPLAVIQRLAEVAAIVVLCVGFGVIVALPGVSSEARGAAALAVVAALLGVSRLARRGRW